MESTSHAYRRKTTPQLKPPLEPAKAARPASCPSALGLQRHLGNQGMGRFHEAIQRKRSETRPQDEEAPPLVQEVISAPGRRLDEASRSYFEPRLEQDLSRIQIHADAKAAASAKQVSAKAYAVGEHVVFGEGQFVPQNGAGRRLLAHELVHTLQQGAGAPERISRVPTEGGVEEGRYTFSTNCGWIDWSHAGPGIGADLIVRVRAASDAIRSAGTGATPETGDLASTEMASRVPYVGTVLSAASLDVRLLRALSPDEILSVALSIFKELSMVFETQQRWTDLIGRSSFAQEDLPSNLVGFYRGARGFSEADINGFCGSLDRSGSLAEYERDHDFEVNRNFTPVGATGPWPAELSTIDDRAAGGLYTIRSLRAQQGGTVFRFCPLYRVEGLIGETDLLITSVGGTRFTAADNLRVRPSYRAYEGTSGHYGHVDFIEVEPMGAHDRSLFRAHDIDTPIYLPAPVLRCLDSGGNPL